METVYMDSRGVEHDIQIFQDFQGEETVYIIHKNGDYFADLVQRDGEWIEVYEGPTERAKEFGQLICRFFDRK